MCEGCYQNGPNSLAGVDVAFYEEKLDRKERFRIRLCQELQAGLLFSLNKHGQTPENDIRNNSQLSQRLWEEAGLDFQYRYGLAKTLKAKFADKAEMLLKQIISWGAFVKLDGARWVWNDIVVSRFFATERGVQQWMDVQKTPTSTTVDQSTTPATPSNRSHHRLPTQRSSRPSPYNEPTTPTAPVATRQPLSRPNFQSRSTIHQVSDSSPAATSSYSVPTTPLSGRFVNDPTLEGYILGERTLMESMQSLNLALSPPSSPTTTRHNMGRDRGGLHAQSRDQYPMPFSPLTTRQHLNPYASADSPSRDITSRPALAAVATSSQPLPMPSYPPELAALPQVRSPNSLSSPIRNSVSAQGTSSDKSRSALEKEKQQSFRALLAMERGFRSTSISQPPPDPSQGRPMTLNSPEQRHSAATKQPLPPVNNNMPFETPAYQASSTRSSYKPMTPSVSNCAPYSTGSALPRVQLSAGTENVQPRRVHFNLPSEAFAGEDISTTPTSAQISRSQMSGLSKTLARPVVQPAPVHAPAEKGYDAPDVVMQDAEDYPSQYQSQEPADQLPQERNNPELQPLSLQSAMPHHISEDTEHVGPSPTSIAAWKLPEGSQDTLPSGQDVFDTVRQHVLRVDTPRLQPLKSQFLQNARDPTDSGPQKNVESTIPGDVVPQQPTPATDAISSSDQAKKPTFQFMANSSVSHTQPIYGQETAKTGDTTVMSGLPTHDQAESAETMIPSGPSTSLRRRRKLQPQSLSAQVSRRRKLSKDHPTPTFSRPHQAVSLASAAPIASMDTSRTTTMAETSTEATVSGGPSMTTATFNANRVVSLPTPLVVWLGSPKAAVGNVFSQPTVSRAQLLAWRLDVHKAEEIIREELKWWDSNN
ncbi:hypothetical protein G7046_g837 [Stylonectria norvegica]|nr:hypothetical protein G7046_g837 [Stylonectria norvegica]